MVRFGESWNLDNQSINRPIRPGRLQNSICVGHHTRRGPLLLATTPLMWPIRLISTLMAAHRSDCRYSIRRNKNFALYQTVNTHASIIFPSKPKGTDMSLQLRLAIAGAAIFTRSIASLPILLIDSEATDDSRQAGTISTESHTEAHLPHKISLWGTKNFFNRISP